MARLVAGCLALLWCLQAAATPTIVLRDELPRVDAQPLAWTWVDPRGDASLAQLVRNTDTTFLAPNPGALQRLPPQGALWLHLRLQRGAKERQGWMLEFPMPLLDRVTVYQLEQGQWRAESAGDTLAVNSWPEPGRYPFFRLDLPPGESRDVFVRIQHGTPADFPVELATEAHHMQQAQLDYLGLGLAYGTLALLIAACLAMSWAYRDPGFAWYAAYAALTTLAVVSYTGVAGQFLWPGFGLLGDAPSTMLASAALGGAVLFVRKTLALRRRLPWLDRLTLALGLLGLALFLLPVITAKAFHIPVVGTYLCVAGLWALLVSAAAWWRGDDVAPWVLAAQFPLVAALVLSVTSALGWADLAFVSPSLIVVAMAIEVPLMLVALFIRTRDRHSAEVRAQALSTHDALTGLLAPHLFTDRLRQVVARYGRNEENAAVMYIELVNHASIRADFGSAVAEQSLLRSVIKLRRLLRDLDTVSRLGEARFGVILEGVGTRASVSERATRLIAAGLMRTPGLKPDISLQFHVAALLLNERPMEAEAIQDALAGQLAHMSPRTRRPIRFIQPEHAAGSETGDSSLFAAEGSPQGSASGSPATAP